MTNISKRVLPRKHQKALLSQLVNMTAKCSPSEKTDFFGQLLTESEQIMLIKRLGAIVLLTQGVSQYRIAQVLLLSTTSVRSYKQALQQGDYRAVEKLVKNKSFDKKQFLSVLEVLLRAGMPPRTKDRWQQVPGFGGR